MANPFAGLLPQESRRLGGIALHMADPALRRTPRRIELSAGTGPAQEIDPQGPAHHPLEGANSLPGYRPGAILPNLPWRAPTDSELGALTPPKSIPPNAKQAVTILRLFEPDPFQAPAGNVLMTLDRRDPDAMRHPALTWMLEEIRRQCAVGGPLSFHGVAQSPPNCLTTTYSTSSGAHFGMHVDDGEKMPIGRLAEARNRISINIGSVDRYLLFVNLTVAEMLECVAPLDIDTKAFAAGLADRVGQSFLNRFPDYPVMKIRLKPGEAYIAPTENMLHEGSSLGIDETGFQFILLGHFKPHGP